MATMREKSISEDTGKRGKKKKEKAKNGEFRCQPCKKSYTYAIGT